MIEVVKTALMITAFVTVMMLLVEYLNVRTGGAWQRRLVDQRWGQYLLGGFLGAIPGCLGAFAAVAMYSHGVLTLGAVVTAMIATSGDEAFIMLALIPRQGLIVIGILFVFGVAVGAIVDILTGNRRTRHAADCLEVHAIASCECYPRGRIFEQWRQCSATRGILAIALLLFLGAVLAGQMGPSEWNWIRASLVAVCAVALFVVGTVPDHFLEDHLWRHVVRGHSPRVLLWTLGALTAMHLITHVLQLETVIQEGKWAMLVAACVVGLIPESGPHLIFVTLYAEGVIPLSTLLASSIVQDGHGMLPMLAHSRREFVLVKAVNFCAGLGFGAVGLSIES
jgi:hypothetical protein